MLIEEPTFLKSKSETLINILVCTQNLNDLIQNFRISDEKSLSDHKYNHFSPKGENGSEYSRNPRKYWPRRAREFSGGIHQNSSNRHPSNNFQREMVRLRKLTLYWKLLRWQLWIHMRPTASWSLNVRKKAISGSVRNFRIRKEG